MTQTVKLHKVLKSTPETIYHAFTKGDAIAKWLPPYGHFCKVHQAEIKINEPIKISFTNIGNNHTHSFFRTYKELLVNEKIVHHDTFDDPNMQNEMITTIQLKKVSCGTELTVTQENIPEEVPLDGCYLGWQESLSLLALLVQTSI